MTTTKEPNNRMTTEKSFFSRDLFSAYVLALSLFAGIGGFLFGYDTGVISGALLLIEQDFENLTSFDKELIVGAAVAGAAVGALISGILNDFLGRKRVILGSCVVFVAGAGVMAAAPGLKILVMGRIITGLGIGLASQTVPVYIAEAAPESVRGSLVSLDVFLITGGQFVSYVVDALFLNVNGTWRWMLGLSAIPAIIQFIGMLFLPDSPRWLVANDSPEKALEILRKTRRDPEIATKELKSIEDTVQQEKELIQALKRNRYIEIFVNPSLRRAMMVGVGLQVLQQVCGINTVMYYSSTILQDAGFGDGSIASAIYASMVVAFANMSMSLIAVAFIDKVGRRILLLGSLYGVVASLLLLGFSFYIENSWLSLVSLILYICFFAPGMGPIPWAINSEIYPLYVRAPANSIATSANWFSNLLVSISFLSIVNWIGATNTFALYSLIAVFAVFFVYFLVPETKGKTLEEIERIFKGDWLVPNFFTDAFKKKAPLSTSSSSSSLPNTA